MKRQSYLSFFSLLALVILLSSCARTIRFDQSTVVPAATGKIKVKSERNGNYVMNIKLFNLAPANRLQPPKATYVVWMESQDGLKNIGQVASKSTLFTRALQASLKAVSPSKPYRVFLTAEDNGTAAYPSSQPILTTGNFGK